MALFMSMLIASIYEDVGAKEIIMEDPRTYQVPMMSWMGLCFFVAVDALISMSMAQVL